MKSLTNILRRSNITPFERVKALVHNDIHREKTGKDGLSDSDIYALTKGWSPSRSEATEYNKYILINFNKYSSNFQEVSDILA